MPGLQGKDPLVQVAPQRTIVQLGGSQRKIAAVNNIYLHVICFTTQTLFKQFTSSRPKQMAGDPKNYVICAREHVTGWYFAARLDESSDVCWTP